MGDLEKKLAGLTGLHERIADAVPQIKRGQVWCLHCGATLKLDGAQALRTGWPKCCGYTMTIDSPEEQSSHITGAPHG